jgi:hypothetical protein
MADDRRSIQMRTSRVRERAIVGGGYGVEALRKGQGVPNPYVSIARAKEEWDEGADTLLAVWTALKWPPVAVGREGLRVQRTRSSGREGCACGVESGRDRVRSDRDGGVDVVVKEGVVVDEKDDDDGVGATIGTRIV